MTKRQGKSGTIDVKALLAKAEEFLRAQVLAAMHEARLFRMYIRKALDWSRNSSSGQEYLQTMFRCENRTSNADPATRMDADDRRSCDAPPL